jgi:hypothetical protein
MRLSDTMLLLLLVRSAFIVQVALQGAGRLHGQKRAAGQTVEVINRDAGLVQLWSESSWTSAIAPGWTVEHLGAGLVQPEFLATALPG